MTNEAYMKASKEINDIQKADGEPAYGPVPGFQRRYPFATVGGSRATFTDDRKHLLISSEDIIIDVTGEQEVRGMFSDVLNRFNNERQFAAIRRQAARLNDLYVLQAVAVENFGPAIGDEMNKQFRGPKGTNRE